MGQAAGVHRTGGKSCFCQTHRCEIFGCFHGISKETGEESEFAASDKRIMLITDLKRYLSRTGFYPNRNLGQNFLINSSIASRIATEIIGRGRIVI